MKDAVTLNRIKLLHPMVRAEAESIYNEITEALTGNAQCRFSYTLRTFKEQTALYNIGRSIPGKKVTNAPAGKSFHNYGLAVDIVLIIDGKTASWDTLKDFDADHVSDWMEIVKIFKNHGWEWGGDFKSFKDYPHFQKTYGYTIDKLYRLYTAKQFIPGSDYIKIE